MDLLDAGSVAAVLWTAIVVILLVIADKEFIEVVGVTLGNNVSFTLEITKPVESADDVVEVGTGAVVIVELTVCSRLVVSTGPASVICVTVVADNGGVGVMFLVINDDTVLSGGVTVSFKVCNLIEVSIVSSLGKVVLVTDVGNVVEAVAVVT